MICHVLRVLINCYFLKNKQGHTDSAFLGRSVSGEGSVARLRVSVSPLSVRFMGGRGLWTKHHPASLCYITTQYITPCCGIPVCLNCYYFSIYIFFYFQNISILFYVTSINWGGFFFLSFPNTSMLHHELEMNKFFFYVIHTINPNIISFF